MDYEMIIFGCAYNCPALVRLTDCPFHEIAHLSLKEKVFWMESINEIKKKSIIQHHIFCSQNRNLNR